MHQISLVAGAGYEATGVSYPNFIGQRYWANANRGGTSNFLGYECWYGATEARNSNFFGQSAGNGKEC
jgi:hypothetical protein